MREILVRNVSNIIRNYRADFVSPRDENVVERWVRQFPEESQNAILAGLGQVLQNSYLTVERTRQLLRDLIASRQDPASYWRAANIMLIQRNGGSQRALVNLLNRELRSAFGFGTEMCGGIGGRFVYIDDVLFTGNRVKSDLAEWIRAEAPNNAEVDVLMLAVHTYGSFELNTTGFNSLRDLAANIGKTINFTLFNLRYFENRRIHANRSNVYWPSFPQSPDAIAYGEQQRTPLYYREVMTERNAVFSNELSRTLLEREFLEAGIRIRAQNPNGSQVLNPLGYKGFGFGFGATIVTYRNCPNNAPLALWWGRENAEPGSALDWFPLLPRGGY